MPGTADWMVLTEVALTMLLGAVIGYEREAARKPAGLPTHMIVVIRRRHDVLAVVALRLVYRIERRLTPSS